MPEGFVMTVPQIIMLVTLLLMLTGRVPLYLTAFTGSTIAAAMAFPWTRPILTEGGAAVTTRVEGLLNGEVVRAFSQTVITYPEGEAIVGVGRTVTGLLIGSLHPVILDMMGVLVFIGIMEKAGFLNAIIVRIMQFGEKVGRGPGVCTAGGIAAGMIGGLTGFTQPAITAVITGPPAIELGVDKDKVAGVIAHAGHLGNFGGITHPTIVAVVATTQLRFEWFGWGWINVIGAIVALSIFWCSYVRMTRSMKKEHGDVPAAVSGAIDKLVAESGISFKKAITPFVVLIIGFVAGFPIAAVGVGSALLVVAMTSWDFFAGEKAMLEGLSRITVPIFATVSFMYMSGVIAAVGLTTVVTNALGVYLEAYPILIMFIVGSIAGLITQSNGASAAIVIPVLTIVLQMPGVHPLTAAVAAAGGPAIMQYYLTGGPVAALATVIPVIPGSDLKLANRFQRPSILFGMLVLGIITAALSVIL